MPKYGPSKGLPLYVRSGLLAGLALALIWMVWKLPLLLVFVPVLATLTYIFNKRCKRKFYALAEERRELSICNFARSFNCREIDTWVIRAIYENLQEYVTYNEHRIPIRADDDLSEILGNDYEDQDESMEEIAQRVGRSIDNTEANPYYGKVSTVRDLVCFINAQPLVVSR